MQGRIPIPTTSITQHIVRRHSRNIRPLYYRKIRPLSRRHDLRDVIPTEAPERAKKRKQDGHVSVKKKHIAERHYDDLGDSLTGLGDEVSSLMRDVEGSAAPSATRQ